LTEEIPDLPVRPSKVDENIFKSVVEVVAFVFRDAEEDSSGTVVSVDPEEEEMEEEAGGRGALKVY